jgi:hypothetical protein
MRKVFLTVILAASCSVVSAEFTYQQTSQMTGGALFEMMKSLGPLAKQAREPNVSTVIVKGNRMATVSKDRVTVVDLDKESITEIDLAKKQYSVVTFAQMKEAMEKMLAQAQARQKGKAPAAPADQPNVDLNYKVSAKATGQTKTVNGISAREVVMEMAMEATDQQTAAAGSMNITIDNWLGNVPGYDEVQAFHRKMGEKMGYAFGSGMTQMAAMRPETLKGFEQVGKEMAKVEGVPVQSIMKMGGSGANPGDGANSGAAQSQQQQARQQSQQPPSQTASDAAVGAALGRLGLGGFGRNRNNQKQQPPAQQTDAPPPGNSPAPASPAGPASLIEMTTDLTSFSPTADASKFEVPAGFKQVENDMVRRAR